MTSRVFAEAGLLVAAGLGAGLLLEELAQRQVLGHRLALGPAGGADLAVGEAPPAPFGEHGWLPLPLGALDLALLWGAAGAWAPGSWWGGCTGALRGQLPPLAVCAFSILPALLSAWLLWLPWRCGPLACALAAWATAASGGALLFWSDALPLLPRARATEPCARAALRRSAVYLLQCAYYAGMLATRADGSCAALAAEAAASPRGLLAALADDAAAHTPQGAHPPHALLLQLGAAVLAVLAVVDAPGGRAGRLWGAGD